MPQPREPVRGVNSEPDTGWPWHLTEYEVAYVQAFNARPVRGESWAGSDDEERRLEQEADGIRAHMAAVPRPPHRVRRNWPWVTGAAVLLLVAAAGIVGGALLTVDAHNLNSDTAIIEEHMSHG